MKNETDYKWSWLERLFIEKYVLQIKNLTEIYDFIANDIIMNIKIIFSNR